MEKALEYLQKAAQTKSDDSDTAQKVDREAYLKQAKDAITDAPAIYHGKRVKALEYVGIALMQLKSGDEGKAITNIKKAIPEVRACIRVTR